MPPKSNRVWMSKSPGYIPLLWGSAGFICCRPSHRWYPSFSSVYHIPARHPLLVVRLSRVAIGFLLFLRNEQYPIESFLYVNNSVTKHSEAVFLMLAGSVDPRIRFFVEIVNFCRHCHKENCLYCTFTLNYFNEMITANRRYNDLHALTLPWRARSWNVEILENEEPT